MKKILYILFVTTTCQLAFSQVKDTAPDLTKEYYYLEEGDSLNIKLNEVAIFPKHKFKSRIDTRYYFWFRKKVFKAYPYAVLASDRLDSINVRLSKIKSKSKRKKYVKLVQKYVEKELTDQLKKMTRTEGRILIKLVHRQTAKTVFENVKELRSGWNAFWYNTQANLFNISLKDEYHPESVNEDYLIEDILQRAFVDELLTKQDSKLEFDAFQILASKKGEVDVEKYKKMFSKKRKKKKRKKKK